MRRAAATAVLLACTACPGPTPGPDPSPTPIGPPAGGAITLAYPSEPATLDPFTRAGGVSVATRDLLTLVMPGLYRQGQGGARIPWLLAREPQVAGDAPREITIDLRADARWSDGRAITVRDLIFTWRRAVSHGAVWSRDPYDRIASVEQVSSTRARIVFTQPFRRWREVFREVLPAHALRTAGQRRRLARTWPVSGGPFILKRWRQGLDMVFERNPQAWPRPPELDRIRVVFVPDGTSALELLEQNKVDVLGPYLAPDWTRRANEKDGTSVSADRGGTFVSLLAHTGAGVLRSAAVRRALAGAIDRERIMDALVQADGERVDGLPDVPEMTLDPDGDLRAAIDLLDEQGWRGRPVRSKGGRDLAATFAFAADDDIAGYLVRAVQTMVSRTRFRLDTVALERRDLEADWLGTDRMELALLVTRGVSARWLTGATGPRNLARLRDRPLDRAFDTLDATGRPGVGVRLATLMPVIPLYEADVVLVSSDVEQVRASATMPLWNVHEWKRAG